MKQEQTITVTIDDLNRSDPADTVAFEYIGTNYEIDLGESNLLALKDALHEYDLATKRVLEFVGGARIASVEVKVPKRRTPSKKRSSSRPVSDTEVRAWARENDVHVSDHGRVPKRIREQYVAAQK